MKQCTRCLEYKPLGLFGSREKGKKKSHCRDCVNKSNLERYHNNSKTRESHRKAALKYRVKSYGLTLDEYNDILVKQNYCCAICKWNYSDKVLCIDHDHVTGIIRGLLCDQCNKGLGNVNDDVDVLKAMIEYLEIHK